VDELKKSLKEKEAFIEMLKDQLKKKVIKEHEKHKSYIEEYKKIVTSLRNKMLRKVIS